jgi:hypothetical protein
MGTFDTIKEWDYRGDSALTLLGCWLRVRLTHPKPPYDPADWGRCRAMCEAFGFDFKNLVKLGAECYPGMWDGFLYRFDELESLWQEEHESGHCQKLYELMLQIRTAKENQ